MEEATVPNNSMGETKHECSDNIISWFDHVSEMAGVVQRQTLRRILEQNSEVEYLKKWLGDVKIEEMEDSALECLYTSLVPVVCHKDLEPFIQRIADGETSPLLTQHQLTSLSLSSGTTEGRQKYVPFTGHSSLTTLQIFTLSAAYRSRVYPIKEWGKVLEFIYSSKQFKTKGGLTVGTATTHVYASQEFKIKQQNTKSFTSSPQEVISCSDYKQSTYCHLLLGLLFHDQIEYIASTFAYSIVQALRSFEEQWQDICNDIKQGNLNRSIITNPTLRNSVLEIIKKNPNPGLGSRLEESCGRLENVDWFGLIPELWPNAKYVYSIMTGSMLPYLKKLRHYTGGKVPLVNADYGSTESWIGVNIDPISPPEDVTFAVIPTFSYFEFIPLRRQSQQDYIFGSAFDHYVEDQPVPLSQVKAGQQYEIILTTFTGLYRCRLGDVVEVAGFHKGTPKLSFICRRKLILTVNIDKNSEKDLQIAVEKGVRVLTSKAKAELVDFTSHAEVEKLPGHYVIYWEIKGEVVEEVIGECCNVMDESFVDYGYVVSRKAASIGPLELKIVERGSFKKILEYFIETGAALSQFKIPRCTTNPSLLRILNGCTVKRYYSTAYT